MEGALGNLGMWGVGGEKVCSLERCLLSDTFGGTLGTRLGEPAEEVCRSVE